MFKSILELIYGVVPGRTPKQKPPRLYLGSPDKFIEIDDWDLFRKQTIPQLEAGGWNAVRMEGQETVHPVPPVHPQDDPVRYYFLGIVGTVPWPRARPKHDIRKFQKPLQPRSSEQDVSSKIWSYFHRDWTWDSDIGATDYDEAQRALSEFMPRHGVFGKGLYADIGYETFAGDDRGSGMLKVVSTAFKDAIESVEPRIHHFFPYEIRCDDDRVIEDYWIFVHRGGVHAVDPTASCFMQTFREDGTDYFQSYVPWSHTEAAENRIVLTAGALGGRHYAIDPMLCSDRPVISAALAEKLRPVLWKNQQPIPVITRE